jgi:ParB/RepB/Spo0J family partition protein
MSAEATVSSATQFVNLDISLIIPSLTNRKTFDPDKLQSLADSIKIKGVLEPIMVRPLPGSRVEETARGRGQKFQGYVVPTHEIVFGERRFIASKMAGKTTIPALIRSADDLAAMEDQLIENLHREDLTDLQEAEGFQKLMELSGISANALAVKLDLKPGYVHAHLKLHSLTADARQALVDKKIDFSRALRIARIPDAKLQVKALKEIISGNYRYGGHEAMTLREAEAHIQQNYMLKLTSATFDIVSLDLVPEAGSCNACPKRTGHDPELFSDVKKTEDLCIDPACFHGKEAAHAAIQVKQAKAKGQTVIAGREAKELQADTYKANFKGYKRLDHADDSPTDQPLRKIIGKQMEAEGITPVMIENPKKNGDLLACLSNEVVAKLLKTVQGQAAAAKTVSKEVRELVKDKKAKSDARAMSQYEVDWRTRLIQRTWAELQGGRQGFNMDVHRFTALKTANALSADHCVALCQFLDLGKIGPHNALVHFVKTTTDPDLVHLLMIMVRDSDPTDTHTYSGHKPNEGMHLVASTVIGKALPSVIKEVQAASTARFFPKTEPTTPAPLTQSNRAEKNKKSSPAAAGATTGKKPGRLSPEDAQLGIAEAMQGIEGKPATGLLPVSAWPFPTASAPNPAQLAKAMVAAKPSAGRQGKERVAADLAPGTRVLVLAADKLRAGVTRFAGKAGQVVDGGLTGWSIKLDGRNSYNAGTRVFLPEEIEVVA